MVEADEILDFECRCRQRACRRYPHRYFVAEAVAALEATATHAEHLRVPPSCFNISGGQFRAGGTYPAAAFDTAHNKLDVLVADIRGTYAGMYFYALDPATLSVAFTSSIPGGSGDRFKGELSAAPNGRLDASFYDRGYSANKLGQLTVTWDKAP